MDRIIQQDLAKIRDRFICWRTIAGPLGRMAQIGVTQ